MVRSIARVEVLEKLMVLGQVLRTQAAAAAGSMELLLHSREQERRSTGRRWMVVEEPLTRARPLKAC